MNRVKHTCKFGEHAVTGGVRDPALLPHDERVDGRAPGRQDARFARDSLLEGDGFELVWGFSCQVVVLGFAESSLFGAGKPFFIPSPAIRFAERAEGVKGPKR
jgi:hypothetical protein